MSETRPVLVTGTHRSGSTWIGGMLALSPRVHYVHEPFNPLHRRSWLRTPPHHRFFHQPPDRPGLYAEDLSRIVALRPPLLAIASRRYSPRHLGRVAEEAVEAWRARRRGARALIKDPLALLLAEWIARSSDSMVVVTVRHPAAFASSVKRLGWRLPLRYLLEQPALMAGDLRPFRAELERAASHDIDVIDHAILVWRVLNSVVHRYQNDHPDWNVVRYEDLADDPLGGFEDLYRRVGLEWSPDIRRAIAAANASGNVAEVAVGDPGGTRRDSGRAMWTWLHRLTVEEINRVCTGTADVWRWWYEESDWTPPAAIPGSSRRRTGPVGQRQLEGGASIPSGRRPTVGQ
ncbi:MAG TPA: sulfotransferase [Nitriliruptorales bacterium]|nr:sulfotransferase [Nitriliruptorales bacterium]